MSLWSPAGPASSAAIASCRLWPRATRCARPCASRRATRGASQLERAGAQGLDRLSFAAADLERDAGWPEAVAGCDFVLHVASPFPLTVPKDEDELIRPARDGALRVLRAARAASVKRVVLTSSFAADRLRPSTAGRAVRRDELDRSRWRRASAPTPSRRRSPSARPGTSSPRRAAAGTRRGQSGRRVRSGARAGHCRPRS